MFGSRVSRRKNNTKASERKRGVKMDLLDLFQEDLTTDLTEQEVTLLNECESVISKGIKAFKEVWGALLEVRDSRLYRKEFRTFEDYCVVKWNLSKRYINRNLKALDTLNNLGPIGPNNLVTESQLRPLTNLEPEIQRQVVKDVQEINPKAPTSLIQDVVNQYGGINAVLKELKLNPDLVFESEQDLINKAKSLIPAPVPVVQEVIKHVEIIKDGELIDVINENKDKIATLENYVSQLKSSLSDKNKSISELEKIKSEKYSLERQLQIAKNDLQRLEALDINEDKVNEAMHKLISFEQRQKQMSETITISSELINVVIDSRKFFAENLLILNQLKTTPDSLENIKNQSNELVDIVENWLIQFKQKFLNEQTKTLMVI